MLACLTQIDSRGVEISTSNKESVVIWRSYSINMEQPSIPILSKPMEVRRYQLAWETWNFSLQRTKGTANTAP